MAKRSADDDITDLRDKVSENARALARIEAALVTVKQTDAISRIEKILTVVACDVQKLGERKKKRPPTKSSAESGRKRKRDDSTEPDDDAPDECTLLDEFITV